MKRTIATSVIVLMGLGLASTGKAEPSASVNLGLNSNYVWRGVTMTNAFVVQPSATVNVPAGEGEFSFDAWMNAEPKDMDAANDISQTGGVRTGVSEIELAADYSHPVSNMTMTGGFLAYRFNAGNAGIDDALNTQELFGKVRWNNVQTTPSLAAYWDIGKVDGLYLEAKATKQFPISAKAAFQTGLTLGVSAGQEKQDAEDEHYNFTKRGLTHADLGIGLGYTAGPVLLTPMVHVQMNPSGQNTRVTGALAKNHDEDMKAWFGLGISYAQLFGPKSSK